LSGVFFFSIKKNFNNQKKAKNFCKNNTLRRKIKISYGPFDAQISKSLGIPESAISYYRKRPSNLELKKSKFAEKKYR